MDHRLIFWHRFKGAGNSFLGGLAAGLALTNGDVFEGTRYLNSVRSHVQPILVLMGINNQPHSTRQCPHHTPSNSLAYPRSLGHHMISGVRNGMGIPHGQG